MGCGQTKHFRGTYTARVHGFTADKELVEKLLGLTVPELKSRALRSGVMKIDIKELRDDSKASQRALVDMILEREAGEEPMELKEGEEPMKRKKIDMTRSELRSTVRKKVKKFTRVIEKQMVIVRKKEDAERAEDEASSRLAYKREHDGAPKGPTGEERLLEVRQCSPCGLKLAVPRWEGDWRVFSPVRALVLRASHMALGLQIKKSYAFVGNSDFRKDTKATYEAIGGDAAAAAAAAAAPPPPGRASTCPAPLAPAALPPLMLSPCSIHCNLTCKVCNGRRPAAMLRPNGGHAQCARLPTHQGGLPRHLQIRRRCLAGFR